MNELLEKLELAQSAGTAQPSVVDINTHKEILTLQKKVHRLKEQLQERQDFIEEISNKAARRIQKLEDNWKKADAEVLRFDELVDVIRKTLVKNETLIRDSEEIRKIIRLIDGRDSVSSFRKSDKLKPIKTSLVWIVWWCCEIVNLPGTSIHKWQHLVLFISVFFMTTCHTKAMQVHHQWSCCRPVIVEESNFLSVLSLSVNIHPSVHPGHKVHYSQATRATKFIWAASRQNQENGMCAQWRLGSTWASAQSHQSSLSTWRKLGSLATHGVHSEDSVQTGWMPRLILVFAGRTVIWYTDFLIIYTDTEWCFWPSSLLYIAGVTSIFLFTVCLGRAVGGLLKNPVCKILWLDCISKWASSWDYGTYHIGDQRKLRRACACAQSRQSLLCSHTWSMVVDEGSDQKSDI